MSTPTRRHESCTAYNQRIDDIMPLERWKAIKGGFFAVITILFAVFVIWMEGDPTAVFFGAVLLLLVYYGVELREVELVRGITVKFKNGHKHENQVDESEDQNGD